MKRAALILCACAALWFTGCAARTNVAWYNPATWFSGSAARAADRAEARTETAAAKVDSTREALIHTAAVEAHKTAAAAPSLPPGRAAEVTTRFATNTAGLLAQVSPLTAAESAESLAIVRGLLSEEAAKREAAERAQTAAETEAQAASRKLTSAQAALTAAQGELAAKQGELRQAFDRENALANELRNQRFKFWAAVAGVIVLGAVALYLRLGLGSIGAALPRLPALIGPDNAAKVIGALDGETDKLHQWLVQTGAAKVRKLKARAEALA